jgi:hypothetical protein
MKAYWGSRGIAPHTLTSALDGGEWSISRPGRFTPRERDPGTHWIGGWLGPRVVLDAVVKRKIPSPHRESNTRTPIVQPVAQRYTDWAITALSIITHALLLSHCFVTKWSIYSQRIILSGISFLLRINNGTVDGTNDEAVGNTPKSSTRGLWSVGRNDLTPSAARSVLGHKAPEGYLAM